MNDERNTGSRQGGRPIDRWRGDFGDAYVDRNVASDERVQQRVAAFRKVLDEIGDPAPRNVLEVGCNIGINLRALVQLGVPELSAVEPNGKARDALARSEVIDAGRLHDATADAMPFPDASFDLVFTSGVLIHIPPEGLEATYREIHRVAGRYILTMEYFSPREEVVSYHGHQDMLFKRDFGGLWLDLFDDLCPVAEGFFWRRTTGLDDLNWWLFDKRQAAESG